MLNDANNNSTKVIKEYALTTTDNPFDPFTDFDKWYAFDEAKGYHSCSYLARIAKPCSYFGDEANINEVNRAIDEICKFNLTGNYTKVSRDRVVDTGGGV